MSSVTTVVLTLPETTATRMGVCFKILGALSSDDVEEILDSMCEDHLEYMPERPDEYGTILVAFAQGMAAQFAAIQEAAADAPSMEA